MHQPPQDVGHDTLIVHGSDLSYFTGKLEAYLRAKGIAYRLQPFSRTGMKRIASLTGVMQAPQVECPDGTWLVDTTPIIAYLEDAQPQPSITPSDAATNFLGLLLEDYADEWLWRPAMHYRWSFPENARLLSSGLAGHLNDTPGPFFVKRWYWRIRQMSVFVRGDGVNAKTRAAVEASYLDTLDALETVFDRRPFVMGQRPSQVDFGLFGPLFRHFSCDPTPARIMRERAPGVYEWTARMWNLTPAAFEHAAPITTVPSGLEPLLQAVTSIYLPYLLANEAACAAGADHVEYRVQATDWREPAKPYRAWCLQQLRRHFAALRKDEQDTVHAALADEDAVTTLRAAPKAEFPDPLPPLPITASAVDKPVDSWWRKRRAIL